MVGKSDREAILRGMKAAMKLHRDLGTRDADDPTVRVDVYGTIARTGALLMFKPLDPLLGAFMREGDTRGIVITSRRPVGQQRFTASHELGHLILDHDPHADDENILRRAPVQSSYSGVPIQEREADAFASHFLFPKFALAKLQTQQNWTRRDYDNPHTIYQASLRFGASYDATIRAYEREKVLSRHQRDALLEIQPRELKVDLIADHKIDDWRNRDVWRLTEHDEGSLIEAGRDDLFLLKLKEHRSSGYLWTFDELERAGFAILKDQSEAIYSGRIGGLKRRWVLGEAPDMANGEYKIQELRPWDEAATAQSLSLRYQRSPGREDGLFDYQIGPLANAG